MKNEIKTIAFRCNYDTITNLQLCIDQISYDIPCIMASISGQYNVRCVFEKVINQLTYDDFISDYPFMHLLYSQLLVCQRVCLQNTVCLICK